VFSFSAGVRQFAVGWRGMALIAITYVYFLIFAQFSFLNRLAEVGIAHTSLKIVMSAMATGGILFSLLPALTSLSISPSSRLRCAFFACGAAAALTRLPIGLIASLEISFLIGAGLGLITVTLVTALPIWIGSGEGALLRIGIGTGIGYWVCNLPPLFTASSAGQVTTAAILCLVGLLIASPAPASMPTDPLPEIRPVTFRYVVCGFTALVWLDSAAFFIIQNTPFLRAGTWQGDLHLWANGILHLAAAILSALLLRKRDPVFVLGLAVLALAIACLCLHQSSQIVLASLFYPVGVSLYSVALVAYPSFLSGPLSVKQRAFRAGLIYAIAGWFGSAMGIGMGQNLHQVPLPFVGLAGVLVLGPRLIRLLQTRRREVSLVAGAGFVALCLSWTARKVAANVSGPYPQTAIERGRAVYISEGCIHCHSQYVRPNTVDVVMWGPTQTMEELRREHPPLIGNRRQGPDLSQVGGRRSRLWLRAHFIHPSAVSPRSFMPSYAYLFQGSKRGDDLLQYVSSLESSDYQQHIAVEQVWVLPAIAIAQANSEDGAPLYSDYCSTCHGSNGATRLTWKSSWKRFPPDLEKGPWLHVVPDIPGTERTESLARIIKFGIPETDMPGHEYLSNKQIASIASWLEVLMATPRQRAELHDSKGEPQ
jgi:cbb3-type cytochrome c oxidase subunit II